MRNNADGLVYQTEKMIKDQAENINDDEKSTLEAKIADVKTALDGTDLEAIKDATESLMSASQEFGQRLYEQAAADQAAAGDAEDDTPSDDDVVDAEIIDDDEQTS